MSQPVMSQVPPRCGPRAGAAALALVLATVVCTACALPQPLERRAFGAVGHPLASATRYAGTADRRVHELWIDLRRLPALRVRLPDGVWLSAGELTGQTLARHGLRLYAAGEQRLAVWHPPFSPGALVGRHLYMEFGLATDDRAASLRLGACGWSFDAVLQAAAGGRSVGFPLTVEDAEALFGPPVRIEQVELLTGLSCL